MVASRIGWRLKSRLPTACRPPQSPPSWAPTCTQPQRISAVGQIMRKRWLAWILLLTTIWRHAIPHVVGKSHQI